MLQEEIVFFGHPNVLSLHKRTVEITKEEHLTLRGDCIIGVNANKACSDLDEKIKNKLAKDESRVRIEIIVGNDIFAITGTGNKLLTFQNKSDIVIRKTNFICPRTLCVKSDYASSDIPKQIVNTLKDSRTKGILRVTVE